MKSRNTVPQESTKCPLTHHTQDHNFIEPALCRNVMTYCVYKHTLSRVEPFELQLNNV